MRRQVYIGAIGYAIGEQLPLNELTQDSSILSKIREKSNGIEMIPVHHGSEFELLEIAIGRSLENGNVSIQDIDAIVVCSNNLDSKDGTKSTELANFLISIGMEKTCCFQIASVECAGFPWALKVAYSLISSGCYQRILLATFDSVAGGGIDRFYGLQGDFPYVTGDAASACIVADRDKDLNYSVVAAPINTWSTKQAINESLETEVDCLVELFSEAMRIGNLSPSEIDMVICNNYSYEVSEFYAYLSSIDLNKFHVESIPEFAHCFSSDSLLNISHADQLDKMKQGCRILVFGSGTSQWGICLLEKIR